MNEKVEDVTTKGNMANTSVARINVKIPPFWKQDPNIWFLQIEAQFRSHGICEDQSKFDIIVSAIEPNILSQVSDILINPPNSDKYYAIKNRLIYIFGESEVKCTQKLLTELELGDRKPSQLLCEMRNLSNRKIDEQFLKTLWLNRLPLNIRSILSVSDDHLEKLSTMADKIWELNPSSLPTNSINVNAISNDEISKLQAQISELSLKIEEISTKDRRRRQRSRSQSREKVRHNFFSGNNVCYYHARFGEKAYRCTLPCDKSKEFQINSEN